ncbi:hypothetical protein D3C76_1105860 [compost metagenome]|jgi:hypothetical protein|nr:hypothetical protein LJPFL01_2193 [Lelliottia jeotgali]
MTHIARGYFIDRVHKMTLYQKMLVFYAVMAAICALITWFLSKDRKRIRFLSAFLVGSTWPMSFPVALLISLF